MSAPTKETMPARESTGLLGVIRSLDWRAVLVVLGAVAVVTEQPIWLRAPLSVAALVGAISFCASRRRRSEPIDTVLRAVGGVAIVFVLLGLVLNFLPTGLTSPGWGLGVGVTELATMLGFASRDRVIAARRAPGPSRRRVIGFVGWGIAVGGVLTAALLLSLASYDRTHIPPVALGADTTGSTTVVTVASGRDAGPLVLRLVTDDGERTVLARDVRVGPGEAAATVRVPASTSGRIELLREDGSRVLRTLILDGSTAGGNG